MRLATQAELYAGMAILGTDFTAGDVALLSLRVAVWAEEIAAIEAEARKSRR